MMMCLFILKTLLCFMFWCLLVGCQDYGGGDNNNVYGQKDSAAYQAAYYNGPLYSADFYAPPSPKNYDNNYGQNYNNGDYQNYSPDYQNNNGQNYDSGGYQNYNNNYNNGYNQYDNPSPPTPNNNDYYNKYDSSSYPPSPNNNNYNYDNGNNPYDSTYPPSPYNSNQYDSSYPPAPNNGNQYDSTYPPGPNTNDYYNSNQYDSTYPPGPNNSNQYDSPYPPGPNTYDQYNNGHDQYQKSPPVQYSYAQGYGYNSDYNGYQNTPPSPLQQYEQSNYDKNYDKNYYTEVVSPPVFQPPPPPVPQSVIPANMASEQLFNFLKELVSSQTILNSQSDFSRLELDSDGHWGIDIVEGWQGNIQHSQNQDLQAVQEERAYQDTSYTMLAAGVLDFENVCTDQNPFHMVRSCREIADDGKCWEHEFVKDHVCDKTCGRHPCPNVCDDLLPEDFQGIYQCWELVSECATQFMIDNNYCASTCKRAPCALP